MVNVISIGILGLLVAVDGMEWDSIGKIELFASESVYDIIKKLLHGKMEHHSQEKGYNRGKDSNEKGNKFHFHSPVHIIHGDGGSDDIDEDETNSLKISDSTLAWLSSLLNYYKDHRRWGVHQRPRVEIGPGAIKTPAVDFQEGKLAKELQQLIAIKKKKEQEILNKE